MKIKLTPDQIEAVIKSKKEELQKNFDNQVKELQKNLDKELQALEKKYQNLEIDIPEEGSQSSSKLKIKNLTVEDYQVLKSQGKSDSEIQKIYNTSPITLINWKKKNNIETRVRSKAK